MNTGERIRLESISLTNFRRFGQDVKISFGGGATVLLAPNGSGKTAIFEAIELALTSGVQRVGDRFSSLIRDGGERAAVNLDFGNWNRKVVLTKAGVQVAETGDLGKLFSDIKAEEIPYLLRMTHLLDQRDRTWFCQQESPNAGEQLAMLPLGRTASQVSAAVARVRPALSRAITELEATSKSKQDALESWGKLITSRDHAVMDLSSPLVPLSELATVLQGITEAEQERPLSTLASIRERWSMVSTDISQRTMHVQATLDKIAGLTSVPVFHMKARTSLEQATQAAAMLKQARSKRESEVNLQKQLLALDETLQNKLNAELGTVQKQLQLTVSHLLAVQTLTRCKEIFTASTAALASDEASYAAVQSEYDIAKRNGEVGSALAKLTTDLANRRVALEKADSAIVEWQKLLSAKAVAELKYTDIDTQVQLLTLQCAVDKSSQATCELNYAAAKSTVEAYQTTFGTIRKAVSDIAQALPIDEGVCPVCTENHGQEELRRRIELALQTMDPRLNEATQRLRDANVDLAAAKKKEIASRSTLISTQQSLAHAVQELIDITNRIETLQANELLAGLDIGPATLYLLDVKKTLEDESTALALKKISVPSELDVEAMTALADRYMQMQNRLAESKEANTKAALAVNDATMQQENIDLGPAPHASTEKLSQDILDIERNIREVAARMKLASVAKAALENAILEDDVNITRVTSQTDLHQVELDNQIAQWKGAGLNDTPTNEGLENAMAQLSQSLKDTLLAKGSLDVIEKELGRIEESHALANAQLNIDQMKGECTEQDFSEQLKSELGTALVQVEEAVERRRALEAFSIFLATGISNIHEQVTNMVPHWQSILKRIVQEPRFSGTSMNYFKKRNKNHAEIAVGLGASVASVADIASQAQMTDIQLSFLLSMATVHRWSPWKALLLDDPTQHHDLIHASSVFDVLRDFIADFGFQVILTTHDAQQARFLMRKLSNDGIDARLWTLRPTNDGMMAEQIGGNA